MTTRCDGNKLWKFSCLIASLSPPLDFFTTKMWEFDDVSVSSYTFHHTYRRRHISWTSKVFHLFVFFRDNFQFSTTSKQMEKIYKNFIDILIIRAIRMRNFSFHSTSHPRTFFFSNSCRQQNMRTMQVGFERRITMGWWKCCRAIKSDYVVISEL